MLIFQSATTRSSVVAVGGASSFIGRYLVRSLRSAGHRVISIDRRRTSRQQTTSEAADSLTWSDVERNGLPDGVESVCNLSGRSILEQGLAIRLSASAYQRYLDELYDSRIGRIRCLAAAAAVVKPKPPNRLVGVSAIGYYPSSMNANPPPVYDEYYTGPPDSSLAGRLCASIESAIFGAPETTPDTRRIAIRMGVVLGQDGGVLANMSLPFRLGLGGPTASGRQPMAWVHMSDAVGILEHAMLAPDLPAPSSPTADVFNAVAPALNTNTELAAALADTFRRPALLSTPGAVLRLMFGADRASIITDGAFVAPKRIQEAGYKFRFTNLREALRDIYSS